MQDTYHYVIYNRPSDHPDSFVVRRWKICRGGPIPDQECHVAASLKKARSFIPKELVRIAPSAGDDPVVEETWI